MYWTELQGDVKRVNKLDGSERYSLTTCLSGPRGIHIVSLYMKTGRLHIDRTSSELLLA
jgi:hypothetical protein